MDLSEQAATASESAEPGGETRPRLLTSSTYINRELSLIEFNRRVLEEAHDPRHPLLELVKFAAILGSNLDEFFMVRVSGLKEQVEAGVAEPTPDGMTPTEELAAIRSRLVPLIQEHSRLWRQELLPALRAERIEVCRFDELTPEEQARMYLYFELEVFPVCTPLAVDPGHPFPHISNLSLNLAVLLEDPDGGQQFARLKVPNVLPRLVPVQADGPVQRFVWLEELLAANLGALFPGMTILGYHAFRVVRDADLEIQELEAEDLLSTVAGAVSRRRFGSVVTMFVNPSMPGELRQDLIEHLKLTPADVYEVDGPLGLSDLMELHRLARPELKDASFVPRVPAPLRDSADIFAAIQQGDILLHHPFDSFVPVVEFITSAALDPQVLAIKQTLYRVGAASPIVEALREAVERGKQVAVIVELRARFDEENNIEWAKALEEAGVHVTYGLVGLKTHAKVALVVRKERDGIRRYVHLGTGNYNPLTARTYTDLGLLTCRAEIGADASELFNYLTGYSKQRTYRKLIVAPFSIRSEIESRIEAEIEAHRRQGSGGRLIFKMNSLVDPALIEQLYRASRAGVQIDLLVRGVCCLRPGVPGVSESIRVISFVGRFLEHSRVYYFRHGGDEEVLIGSADLMPRNLDRRVETLVPVDDPHLCHLLRYELLEAYLNDRVRSRQLQSDGTYRRLTPPARADEPSVVGHQSSGVRGADGRTAEAGRADGRPDATEDAQAVLLTHALADAEGTPPPTAHWRYLYSHYGRVDTQE